MKLNIAVVTGTRADFGLLKWLMLELQENPNFNLQIIATGTHFSEAFGSTYQEIEQAGFVINSRIDMLFNEDSSYGTSKSIGLAISGFSDAYVALKPDILVVLGDRYEILAAVSAALAFNIPVAHLHGGEKTEGAFDELIRHAITKMSHMHFVASEDYRNRVIQMGEQPHMVFNVGGFGLDAIARTNLFSREDVEQRLGVQLMTRNIVVTHHPVTLESKQTQSQEMDSLLEALSNLNDTRIIITTPNADPGASKIRKQLEDFAQKTDNAVMFKSLGQRLYYSLLSVVDGVVGNSSSGLLEAPTFNIGTVNIGTRQNGRLRSQSVIDCDGTTKSISDAINKLYSTEFQTTLKSCKNPYGEPGAASKCAEKLGELNLRDITHKPFFDMK